MLATQWKLKAGVRGEIKFLLFSLTHFIPDVGPRKRGSHLEWLDHFEPHFWPVDGNLTDWKCKLSNTRGFAWGCHAIMRSDSWRHLMGPWWILHGSLVNLYIRVSLYYRRYRFVLVYSLPSEWRKLLKKFCENFRRITEISTRKNYVTLFIFKRMKHPYHIWSNPIWRLSETAKKGSGWKEQSIKTPSSARRWAINFTAIRHWETVYRRVWMS